MKNSTQQPILKRTAMGSVSVLSFLCGSAFWIALLGAVGCMGENDSDVDDVPVDESPGGTASQRDEFSSQSEHATSEDVVGDPELAAAIAETKIAMLGADMIFHAVCGQVGEDLDSTVTTDAAFPNAANQYSCSAIVGVLQPTDDADYWCFTFGNDGFTWTYLRNMRTNVKGWVRDDLLRDSGSFDHCGF